MMRADIFIPTTNNAATLHICLGSLIKLDTSSFRVILIGIKPLSSIQSVLRKYPTLTIVYKQQKKPGLVEAANEAVRLAKNPIFIRIDDDVEVSPYWLYSVLDTFKKNTGAVTGPTLIKKNQYRARDSLAYFTTPKKNMYEKFLFKIVTDYLYEGKLVSIGRFTKGGNFSIGSNFASAKNVKQSFITENLEACNFAVRLQILKKIGGFNNIYNKGLGDYHEADLAFTIRRLGYEIIFQPKAYVHHRIELNTRTVLPDSFHRIANFIFFYRKNIAQSDPDSVLKFILNLLMQNIYYVSLFLRTGDVKFLSSFPGSIYGLLKKL